MVWDEEEFTLRTRWYTARLKVEDFPIFQTTVHDSPYSGKWLAHAHKDLVHGYQAPILCPANFNTKIGPGDKANATYTLLYYRAQGIRYQQA